MEFLVAAQQWALLHQVKQREWFLLFAALSKELVPARRVHRQGRSDPIPKSAKHAHAV